MERNIEIVVFVSQRENQSMCVCMCVLYHRALGKRKEIACQERSGHIENRTHCMRQPLPNFDNDIV